MEKGSANSTNNFNVFVDEHSPEQAMHIERAWKKKLNQQKSRCYTFIMIAAVVVMIIIFSISISFLSSPSAKNHVELANITHMNTKYSYLQSNLPHLKFLVPYEDTKEIKTLKALGIIYPELISWIESNVSPNMKILFIPNESSMVNVLGISLAYPLRQTLGGRLTIGLTGTKYSQMTLKNIELMNKDLQQPMPVNLIFLEEYQGDEYDLIVLENNIFHQKLQKITSSKLIMIRRQSSQTSIMNEIFVGHSKFQIVRGKTNADIRSLSVLGGFAIIPYISSAKSDSNIILLLPNPIGDLELCQEQNSKLYQASQVRNLVQHLKNRTFINTSIFYGIENYAGLEIISTFPTISKLYASSGSLSSGIKNVIEVNSSSQIIKSAENVYVLNYDSALNFSYSPGDQLIVQIESNQSNHQIVRKYQGSTFKLSILSPYNNKGCFYPPAVVDYSSEITLNRAYFIIILSREPKAHSPQN